MGTKTTEETIRYWRQHVEAFKASGLTRKEYSRQARINVYKLDYWRKKLSRMDAMPVRSSAGQWVPLTISEESLPVNPHIDLWIGRIRVEVKQGFDTNLLADILQAIGASC
jgi:hypothetical protein